MKTLFLLLVLGLIILPFPLTGQVKVNINDKKLIVGEVLNYKASWGFLTIGSATTKVDRRIYKLGSNICYKIQLSGKTNGLAKLFYLNDYWVSYINTQSFFTHKAYRSISEGKYRLDELTYFDHPNEKAEVKVLNRQTKKFVLKKIHKTPENIRDVVAGFMLIRLIDFSKYKNGDRITIDGFYEDTGYKIDIIMEGKETIKSNKGKVLCYKIKPIVPKNRVFDGMDAVDVWVSANKVQCIVQIRAKLVLGDLCIDLQ
jgi:hypothetical protein